MLVCPLGGGGGLSTLAGVAPTSDAAGVPTLAGGGGTYLGRGVPTMDGGLPTLDVGHTWDRRGTYPG